MRLITGIHSRSQRCTSWTMEMSCMKMTKCYIRPILCLKMSSNPDENAHNACEYHDFMSMMRAN